MIINQLTRKEIEALLPDSQLGRLACARDGQPYVVPVHFAFSEMHLYVFSHMGQKIEWMRENPRVCVQVDHISNDRTWWSIVISGKFEELPENPMSRFDRGHAWDLLKAHANWWEPAALKPSASVDSQEYVYYRIQIDEMTGRQCH